LDQEGTLEGSFSIFSIVFYAREKLLTNDEKPLKMGF